MIVGAVLDHQANKQTNLPLDPTLPVELQGIIKRSDYQITNTGYSTDCWIWKKRDGMVQDPYSDRPDQRDPIEEVVYRRFSGEKLPGGRELITRCGNFYNGGVWNVRKAYHAGRSREHCINPDHFAVISKRENSIIKEIRYRKTEEITQDQRRTIAELGKRRNWTEREQGLIFLVSSEDMQDDQDPVNQGLAKAEQGDYAGAIADCDEAIERDPNDADAYILRGLVKTDLGDYQDAIDDFNQSVNLDPDNIYVVRNPRAYLISRFYLLMSVTKIATEDHAGAISDLDEAIEHDPDYARAHQFRAAAKFKLEDYNGAMADRKQAEKLDPGIGTSPEKDATIQEPEPSSANLPVSVQDPVRVPQPRPVVEELAETETKPEPQIPTNPSAQVARKSKTVAGWLAFFLGSFGAHKFYLGYNGAGIAHLALSLTIIGAPVNALICIAEFLIYMTKSDEEFHQTYVVNKRRFF